MLLAVGAAPAAADPTAILTRGDGNNTTLEFTADRSTDTITVTLGGGATLNGPVTPPGGGGRCNPTPADRFHCAFSRRSLRAAKVLVEFATTQLMPDNAGGQFTGGPAGRSGRPLGRHSGAGPELHPHGRERRKRDVGRGGVLIETIKEVGKESDPDRATVFSGLGVGGRSAFASVPALAPSGQPGSSASFNFMTGFDASAGFVFTPLGTLFTPPLGARTLVARLDLSGDPAAPGLNEDRLVTTFTLAPQPRNDSNIRVARVSGGARARREPAAPG